MKPIANEQFWAEQIARYLSGNSTDAEARTLMDWVDEREENKEYFEGMTSVWQMTEVGDEHLPDIDRFWSQAQRNLDGFTSEARVIPMRSAMRAIAAVAAVVLFVLAINVVDRNMQSSAGQPILVSAENDSVPHLVILPDNSKVWLRGGSDLSYDSKFKERVVRLTGEAFFDVESDPENPFSVESGTAVANVLGTRFNIKQLEDGDVELFVEEGRVEFGGQEAASPIEKEVFGASQSAVFRNETKAVEQVEDVNVNKASWLNGKLTFVDTPLEDVLRDLEEHYGQKYSIEDSALYTYDLNVVFNNSQHAEVINAIEFMLNIEFEQDGDTLRLKEISENPTIK